MEFENLQIEVPVPEVDVFNELGVKVWDKKYKNLNKGFVVGFNPNTKEFLERKIKRAKRFGVKEPEAQQLSSTDQVGEAKDPFADIDLYNLEWPPVADEALAEIRQDAIHVYGVSQMSTKDVFDYFDLYGPEHIEWIDDLSCNVVWDDRKIVMRAMDELSQTFAKLSKAKPKAAASSGELIYVEIKQEDDAEEDEGLVVVPDDIAVQLSPKDVWRIAVPYKAQQLFFRAATIKDKKLPGASQRSEFYLKYGRNPDATQNGTGIITKSRKRKLRLEQQLAEERFKSKEPDVKIVDLAELKREGIVQKMEVDEGEPVVKRLNTVNESSHPERTMHADIHEMQERLGSRYSLTVRDRLDVGNRSPLSRDDERVHGYVRTRLGSNLRQRLGQRPGHTDEYTQRYEEDDECLHDIYHADNVSESRAGDAARRGSRLREASSSDSDSDGDPRRRRRSRVQSRVGSAAGTERSQVDGRSDLRGRLQNKDVKKEKVKSELGSEKPNLCIEIKREPDDFAMGDDEVDVMADDDFEF